MNFSENIIDSGDSTQEREYAFDYMRVAAAFMVMIVHVAAQSWYKTDIHSFEWIVMNFYHCFIVRVDVPLFVMISGSLFLSKDVPLKKIFSKYILRIITAFLFWSFIYAVYSYSRTKNFNKSVDEFIRGHYHMWFQCFLE